VIEIPASAGDQTVNDADLVAAPNEHFREMRTDEAGAAGNEVSSHSVELGCKR
jgi:hypothetical protein